MLTNISPSPEKGEGTILPSGQFHEVNTSKTTPMTQQNQPHQENSNNTETNTTQENTTLTTDNEEHTSTQTTDHLTTAKETTHEGEKDVSNEQDVVDTSKNQDTSQTQSEEKDTNQTTQPHRLVDHPFFQTAKKTDLTASPLRWMLMMWCAKQIKTSFDSQNIMPQKLCLNVVNGDFSNNGNLILEHTEHPQGTKHRIIWGRKAQLLEKNNDEVPTSWMRNTYREMVAKKTKPKTIWKEKPDKSSSLCGGGDVVAAWMDPGMCIWNTSNHHDHHDTMVAVMMESTKKTEWITVIGRSENGDWGAEQEKMGVLVQEDDLIGFAGFLLKILSKA